MEVKSIKMNFNGYRIYCIGKHNMKKCNGSNLCAKLMQIRKATIRESLSSFQGVEHRLRKY
jgi:UDP-N-acetylmuramoylalanine-D-glutamate ligase